MERGERLRAWSLTTETGGGGGVKGEGGGHRGYFARPRFEWRSSVVPPFLPEYVLPLRGWLAAD